MDAPQLAAALQAAEAADSSAEAMSETEHASVMQQQQQQQQQQQGSQHQPVPEQQDRGPAARLAAVHSGRQQETAEAGLRMAVLTSAARLLEAKVTVVHGQASAQCIARPQSDGTRYHWASAPSPVGRGDGGP
jgi:hypothetical protein